MRQGPVPGKNGDRDFSRCSQLGTWNFPEGMQVYVVYAFKESVYNELSAEAVNGLAKS